jgi:biotin synthase
VPVNFLIPFEGTPLAKEWNLTPQRCLRILAMVRFVCPDVEVRLAGGREVHLRSLQPLALHLVNSIFLGDYLTSEGQAGQADLDMIADAGFVVEGSDEKTLARDREQAAADLAGDTGLTADGGLTAGADLPEQLSDRRRDLVSVRRRGAGTDLPPNA